MSPKKEPGKPVVFFDFDNTITPFDVFDDMVARFSVNDRWVELEERWKKGEIGSRECLQGQLKGVEIERRELDKYLASIPIDPYFKKIVAFLREKGIKVFILSDNFDFFLKRILKYHGITNVPVYCNKARFVKQGFSPSFPHLLRKCPICAHCKTKNLLANTKRDSIIIYIGDGRSDICPAENSELVFAKGELLKHCRKNGIACISHRNLKQVHDYFKRILR